MNSVMAYSVSRRVWTEFSVRLSFLGPSQAQAILAASQRSAQATSDSADFHHPALISERDTIVCCLIFKSP